MNIKKISFTTLLLLLSILTTGCSNSTKSITNDIEDYEFENAYSNYLENIKSSDDKSEADIKIETSLNTIYDNVIDKYAAGEVETEEITFLKEIVKEISAEDSEKFRDFLRNVNEIESSINSYNKGIDSYNNNEYSSALSYFEQVDEIDVAHFSDAEKKIVKCRGLITEEKNVSIRELIANDEFDKALEEINKFSYIDETDAYRLSLETKAAVTKKADEKIEKYFSELDYFSAHDYITELSSKYNFDTLKDRVDGLENNYIIFALSTT